MNKRLNFIFLLLAALITFAAINYDTVKAKLFMQSDEPIRGIRKDLARDQIVEFFKSQKWYDYNSKSIGLDLTQVSQRKPVYLHIWASWCGPCLNEIPELIDFAAKNKEQGIFVLISLDETQEELVKFLKSFPEMNEAHFVKIWDYDKKISKKLDVDRLPMTVILEPVQDKVRTIRAVVDWKNLK